MAPMTDGDRLTVGGFLARFAFALLVVGATYDLRRSSSSGSCC